MGDGWGVFVGGGGVGDSVGNGGAFVGVGLLLPLRPSVGESADRFVGVGTAGWDCGVFVGSGDAGASLVTVALTTAGVAVGLLPTELPSPAPRRVDVGSGCVVGVARPPQAVRRRVRTVSRPSRRV